MSSITNQIVANIKKTSTNFNTHSFTNSENVVCIDTSFNRIGINRKNPVYSIDISGDTSLNAVRCYDLHINNVAKIGEVSCNRVDTLFFTSNLLDVSYLTYNTIVGQNEDLSYLVVHDISTLKLFVPDLSTNSFDVSNNINTNTLNVKSELVADLIRAQVIIFPLADLSYLEIDTSGDIVYLSNQELSSNFITSHELSLNRLFVNDKLICLNETSFNNIRIDGNSSLNNLNVDNLATFTELSSNKIEFNELSGNTINANTLTSNGTTIINNGVFGDITAPTNAVFQNLVANTLDICNIYITNYLDNSGLTDLSNGTLILPDFNKQTTILSDIKPGTFAFDSTFNILKVYNTVPQPQWNNILFNINYATLTLRRDISGNNVEYDIHRKHFYIEQSNNLFIDKINHPNTKYIPLVADISFGNKLDISNNGKTIEIKNRLQDELFEIHASVGIKYLNADPGDVEPNVYTFGLYPHMNTFYDISDSIDNSFAHLNNTVLVFDNSFNYANTSINYIGPLANTVKGHNIADRSGFNFYITAEKDINYIAIDSFNATIKQLQNY